MGVEVTLNDVRLGYTGQLFTAQQFNGEGAFRFGATVIFAPGSQHEQQVTQAIIKVAQDKWGDQAMNRLAGLRGSDKFCLKNGNTKPDVEGYAGNLFIAAYNRTRIPVVDQALIPIAEEDGKIWAGDYVNVVLDFYSPKAYGGISAGLNAVQLLRKGERIAGGGAVDPAQKFQNIAMPAAQPMPGGAVMPGAGLV